MKDLKAAKTKDLPRASEAIAFTTIVSVDDTWQCRQTGDQMGKEFERRQVYQLQERVQVRRCI